MRIVNTKPDRTTKREYTVAFECASSFLVGFEDTNGLTQRQIIDKAIRIANRTFKDGANIRVEHSTHQDFYELTALGYDRTSASILGKPAHERPKLRLVKTPTGTTQTKTGRDK